MLAKPGLVEAHFVHVLNEVEVTLNAERWILTHRVNGGNKGPESEFLHGGPRTWLFELAPVCNRALAESKGFRGIWELYRGTNPAKVFFVATRFNLEWRDRSP
jgi:hypothetical protein